MDRRTFNKLIALGGMEITASSRAKPLAVSSSSPADQPAKWPDQTFRRFSIDTHVPDWDPELLGHFNPVDYVDNIARAGLLNMQQLLPPIPVEATVRVQLPSGRSPSKVVRAPDLKPVAFKKVGPYVQFRMEPFDVFTMALVEYQ